MSIAGVGVSLLEAAGLMALLAVFYGMAQRAEMSAQHKSFLTGLMFGCGAIAAMLAPAEIRPGMLIDGRAIFVGLGAAFGGWPAALIASSIAASYRLYLGGAGAIAGATGVVLAGGLGLLWAGLCPNSEHPTIRSLMVAGAIISLQFLAVYVLPLSVANSMMLTVFPLMFISSIVNALILGLLVDRERRLMDSEARLKRDTERDPLTGVFNRRYFNAVAGGTDRRAVSRDAGHVLAIFDIDHFKSINDRFGHAAGDKALIGFADTLRSLCRSTDVVARLGGEEFAILMPNTPLKGGHAAVERILAKLRNVSIDTEQGPIHLTASAGITAFWPSDNTLDRAMVVADKALYDAKNSGRDRAVLAAVKRAA